MVFWCAWQARTGVSLSSVVVQRVVSAFRYRSPVNNVQFFHVPVAAGDACFPKQMRLLRRNEFVRLSESKHVVSGRLLLVVWHENGLGYPRLGITASRKAGNAVVRNRIKRCIRDFFRRHHALVPGVDLNVIVRRQAAESSSAAFLNELRSSFQQIGSCTCCHEFS